MTHALKPVQAPCSAPKKIRYSPVHNYHMHDAQLAKLHTDMQLATRITQALEDARFRLNFQPIIPAVRGRNGCAHYEFLLRMVDEKGRILAPAAFLPVAERYHLATRIDRWVIATAFQWLEEHPEQHSKLDFCAINLSGHSLGNGGFLAFVIEQISTTPVAPEKICFEITETATIANFVNAMRFIEALQKLGCRFALDDFGTGWSSFAYLKSLPVDFLKIDGSFVRNIIDDPRDLAMVKSINEVSHVMGKKTIAEFVENEAVHAKLQEIGVDYVQGFHIGRPQPLAMLQ